MIVLHPFPLWSPYNSSRSQAALLRVVLVQILNNLSYHQLAVPVKSCTHISHRAFWLCVHYRELCDAVDWAVRDGVGSWGDGGR